jgi:outer membrane protein
MLIVLLSGCAGAPVKIGDNKIERPLQEVTGLTTEDIHQAAQKESLNLWDVYALAVKHTEDLAAKYENIEQADAQSQQAIASILPQIFLNDRKNWQSTDYVFGSSNSLFTPLGNSIYVSARETIFSGLDQVAAIQGAGALLDQNRHLFRQEARNLLLAVARSFYTALQAEDTLRSKREILKLTEEILKQEQKWKAIGRSRDTDVLSVQAQLAQINADLENAQNQLTQAGENLAVLANLKPQQSLRPEESAVAVSYTLAEAEAHGEDRSDVLAARSGTDLADAQLLQAHGAHLPSLALQGQYFLQQDGGSPTPNWNFQLVASLPLFEGGAIFAQERLAASKKRQAEMQYSLIRRQAHQDIRAAYQSLESSLKQVNAYRSAMDAAQKDYEAVERDRKLALNTNLDLLQSLTQLQNAENNYNQAHYQALIDRIWLGVATGELPKTKAETAIKSEQP